MAKRWSRGLGRETTNKRVDAFLSDLAKLSEKHGLAISHEDTHGAFLVEKADGDLLGWVQAAHVGETLLRRHPQRHPWQYPRVLPMSEEAAKQEGEQVLRAIAADMPDFVFAGA